MKTPPKLSLSQQHALHQIDRWSEQGVYMPYRMMQRSFDALERKGLIEYVSVSDGHKRNGYRRKVTGK